MILKLHSVSVFYNCSYLKIIVQFLLGENGKHDRLKICSFYEVEGSSPSAGNFFFTKYINMIDSRHPIFHLLSVLLNESADVYSYDKKAPEYKIISITNPVLKLFYYKALLDTVMEYIAKNNKMPIDGVYDLYNEWTQHVGSSYSLHIKAIIMEQLDIVWSYFVDALQEVVRKINNNELDNLVNNVKGLLYCQIQLLHHNEYTIFALPKILAILSKACMDVSIRYSQLVKDNSKVSLIFQNLVYRFYWNSTQVINNKKSKTIIIHLKKKYKQLNNMYKYIKKKKIKIKYKIKKIHQMCTLYEL